MFDEPFTKQFEDSCTPDEMNSISGCSRAAKVPRSSLYLEYSANYEYAAESLPSTPSKTILGSLKSLNLSSPQQAVKSVECSECGRTFQGLTHLRNHRKAAHINVFLLKSEVDGRVIATFERNLSTKYFHCVCGGKFASTANAYYHRKCFEISVVKKIEIESTANGK